MNNTTLKLLQDEQARTVARFGIQHHPNGTARIRAWEAERARELCDRSFAEGRGTWRHILAEEFHEAMCEEDQQRLLEELVQVMNVADLWIQDLTKTTGRKLQRVRVGAIGGGRLVASPDPGGPFWRETDGES